MKFVFWNIRGITNSPSRLALKRIILSQRPDIILIAEPMMNFDHFRATWLQRLGLKLFDFNVRNNNLPNIWCICNINLSPNIIACSDQHVSFTFILDSLVFGISAIYASTCYTHIRHLWHDLSNMHSLFPIPWCCFGDFNTIIGAEEHRGPFPPARLPMTEFLN